MKLEVLFRWLFGSLLVILLAILSMGGVCYRNLMRYDRAVSEKDSAYELVESLWDAMEFMSKNAREYVASGNREAKEAYERERRLRIGEEAREDGRKVSFRKLFEEAGFTAAELRATDKAERAMDSIEQYIERKAFAAMEGLYDDGSGHYTRKGIPDTAFARNLLFDGRYETAKKKQFVPFLIEAENLLLSRLESVQRSRKNEAVAMGIALLVLVVVGCVVVYLAMLTVRRKVLRPLGAEPSEMQQLAQSVAQGRLKFYNLTTQSDRDVAGALAIMSNRLLEVIENVQQLSETLEAAGVKLGTMATTLAEGSNMQASSTEEMASTIEEVVSTLHASSDSAQGAKQLAVGSMQVVESNVDAAQEALSASNEIYTLVRQIGEIAQQTNILALNAAVEAARAGEQGRGFAVVAGEVRKLADASGSIAEKIVAVSQRCAEATSRTVEQSTSVSTSMRRNAELIDEISTSQREITKGAEGINVAAQQLSVVAQRTASSSEELANFSKELRENLVRLQESIGFFSKV